MIQHNFGKLKRIFDYLIKAVLWICGITIFILTIISRIPLNYNTISMIISILSVLLALLWSWFEKALWKRAPLYKYWSGRYWTPILEGRWEGTLTREGQNHEFVLEIKQSYTTISCITYSEHSSSSSVVAEILYNEQLQTYQLVYYWTAKTRNTQKGTGDTNYFNGFTILDIMLSDRKALKMSGSYFTDRQPNQTKGELKLEHRQIQLKNSFDS